MQDFVVSKDLAEKLKAANFPQNTEWYWSNDGSGDWYVMRKGDAWLSKDCLAAPLSDEILAQLPTRLNRKDRSSWNLTVWKTEKNLDGEVHYSADYTEGMTGKMLVGKIWLEQDKLPDALATLWLFCKANNYLEKE